MSILFKGLRIIDSNGSDESNDYIFDKGEFVVASSSNPLKVDQEIHANGWLLSAGWIDLRCSMGEPGHEYKESIESLAYSLVTSGFSAAVVLPNTDPVIQTKGDVDYVLNRAKRYTPEFLIQGAVTKNTDGENLTEILDMHHQSGVSIFGEGVKPLANGDRYMKILQYLQKFDGVLFDHAYDPLLAIFGQMHEGENSTMLGMKGIPNLAEDVAIQRNLEIIRYADFDQNDEGQNILIDGNVVDNDVYKWADDNKYKYSVKYKSPKYGNEQFIKERTKNSFENINVRGTEYSTLKFMDEYEIKSLENEQNYKFYQFTYYAKDIGMVKYQRYHPDGTKIELELDIVLSEQEFEKVSGKASR